jgi:hypothetical protein
MEDWKVAREEHWKEENKEKLAVHSSTLLFIHHRYPTFHYSTLPFTRFPVIASA